MGLTERNNYGTRVYAKDTVYNWRKPERTQVCAMCGKEFKTRTWNAKYCSDACRKAAATH